MHGPGKLLWITEGINKQQNSRPYSLIIIRREGASQLPLPQHVVDGYIQCGRWIMEPWQLTLICMTQFIFKIIHFESDFLQQHAHQSNQVYTWLHLLTYLLFCRKTVNTSKDAVVWLTIRTHCPMLGCSKWWWFIYTHKFMQHRRRSILCLFAKIIMEIIPIQNKRLPRCSWSTYRSMAAVNSLILRVRV